MTLIYSPEKLAEIMRQGGVIAYPTEAVWGLGCDPFNQSAVQKILKLKARPVEKGLILVAGKPCHLLDWTKKLSLESANRLTSKTSIPTSWVVPDTTVAPPWIRGKHESVAIRLSQHTAVRNLCNAFNGAIVSTSANPAGLNPALSKEEVYAYFGDEIDAIYDASLGESTQPSQVKDLISDTLFRL